jgi:hypothetical protein
VFDIQRAFLFSCVDRMTLRPTHPMVLEVKTTTQIQREKRLIIRRVLFPIRIVVVEVLCYKPKDRGLVFRCDNFFFFFFQFT